MLFQQLTMTVGCPSLRASVIASRIVAVAVAVRAENGTPGYRTRRAASSLQKIDEKRKDSAAPFLRASRISVSPASARRQKRIEERGMRWIGG